MRTAVATKPTQSVQSLWHPTPSTVYKLIIPPFPCTFQISYIFVRARAPTEGLKTSSWTETDVFRTTLSSVSFVVFDTSFDGANYKLTNSLYTLPIRHRVLQHQLRKGPFIVSETLLARGAPIAAASHFRSSVKGAGAGPLTRHIDTYDPLWIVTHCTLIGA